MSRYSVIDVQKYLKAQGYNPGPLDGLWGPKSKRAYELFLESRIVKQRRAAIEAGFPKDSPTALVAYYGRPSEIEDQLVRVAFPWKCYYDGRPKPTCRIHPKLEASLTEVFADLWDLSGRDQRVIDYWDLSNFSGDYANRNIAGSNRISCHAMGAALDFDAEDNPNSTSSGGRARATMPEEVIDVFEAHGWKSGGRSWGRDYMHFQATQ
jgi:hypothetical protein